MEKRTIIAFALSFLVLLAWSFLYSPTQGPPPSEEPSSTRKEEPLRSPAVPSSVPTPAREGSPVQALERAPRETEEKEVLVDTPLYKAVFSNRGAIMKSFKLKKYHETVDPKSPFIELVQLDNLDTDFIRFDFESPSHPGDKKIFYQVDKEGILLTLDSQPQELTFKAIRPDGMTIAQIYRFYPEHYHMDIAFHITNHSSQSVEGSFKTRIQNLSPTEKKSSYSFIGVALLLNDKLQEIESDNLDKGKALTGRMDWMAYENDFFMTAIIPENPAEVQFKGQRLPTGLIEAVYTVPPISLKPQTAFSYNLSLYLGPRDLTILKQLGKKLDLAINFGWTDIIAKPLIYTLRFCNGYVHNYGVSIIILTILIKILFWPLTHKSYKSMKEMQKLQPLMAKLRERYKDNKEQMNRELMGLYKTYKVNPMGGCLPMIIQIPVFFALFRILGSTIELRHAPFILWINDLSAPDRLFQFPFSIPFMTPPYGIPVLTLFMGASMFIQQKMTPTPGDPTQAKIMLLMPIIFTVMFINFPSGLVLYWLINNILSIGQQYRIKIKT